MNFLNLVANAPQLKPNYEVDPSKFCIEVYFNFQKEVYILARKDNTYIEWFSMLKLTNFDNSVGACIKFILLNSPLETSTTIDYILSDESTLKAMLPIFFKRLFIQKNEDKYWLFGHEVDSTITAEEIQKFINQEYDNYTDLNDLGLTNGMTVTTVNSLNAIIQELKKRFDEDKYNAYNKTLELRTEFQDILDQNRFVQDETVKKLMIEGNELINLMYNGYSKKME